MIFPKCVLVGGALAGLTGPLRLGSQEGKVLVTEAYTTALDIFFVDLAPRASGKSPAIRSLEVAELDHGNRRVGIALEMASLAYHKRHQLWVGSLIWWDGCGV